MSARNSRSPEAIRYNRLYKTARWLQLREQILVRDRYTCQMPGCGRVCIGKNQAHVDHIEPHKGDLAKFWSPENLHVLCLQCHSGAKQSEERRGYSSAVDASGWPTDPRHPANARRGA